MSYATIIEGVTVTAIYGLAGTAASLLLMGVISVASTALRALSEADLSRPWSR